MRVGKIGRSRDVLDLQKVVGGLLRRELHGRAVAGGDVFGEAGQIVGHVGADTVDGGHVGTVELKRRAGIVLRLVRAAGKRERGQTGDRRHGDDAARRSLQVV